jgi:hypothetical protein
MWYGTSGSDAEEAWCLNISSMGDNETSKSRSRSICHNAFDYLKSHRCLSWIICHDARTLYIKPLLVS